MNKDENVSPVGGCGRLKTSAAGSGIALTKGDLWGRDGGEDAPSLLKLQISGAYDSRDPERDKGRDALILEEI